MLYAAHQRAAGAFTRIVDIELNVSGVRTVSHYGSATNCAYVTVQRPYARCGRIRPTIFPLRRWRPLYGVGCRALPQRGLRRRMGFELLITNEEIRDLAPNESAPGNQAMCPEGGMRTLRMDAWDKAMMGRTSVEEVLRVTKGIALPGTLPGPRPARTKNQHQYRSSSMTRLLSWIIAELLPIEVTLAKSAFAPTTSGSAGGDGQYNQLAALLRSGVPLLRSLTVLANQTKKATLKSVLEEIKSKVEDGEPLPTAMARFPRVFSDMAVNMVRAGNEGGFLEDSLERVAAFTEQQEDMKGRAAGALAYPIFLGVVGISVVTVLIVFFVPKFEPLFAGLRANNQLPAATDMLLSISNLLQNYWWILIGGLFFAILGAMQFLQTEAASIGWTWPRSRRPCSARYS